MGYDTTIEASNNDPAQGVHTLKSGRAVATVAVHTSSSDVTEETFRRHLKTFLFNCLDN